MQVIFALLYVSPRSGLGIWEFIAHLSHNQRANDSQRACELKKAGGNMCETTGRLAQARRLRPKGVLYNTTRIRESQARRRKKADEASLRQPYP